MRVVILSLGFALFGVGAGAAPIAINNASFESPTVASFSNGAPTGWSLSGGGDGGMWNITDSPLGFWSVGAPDGLQVAWLSRADSTSSAQLDQTLSAALEDSTMYTLTGMVGHPTGFGSTLGTVFTASLLAGGNVVDSVSGTGPEGSFATFSLMFDSTGSQFVGGALAIRLETNQRQTAFDAISLDATPIPAPAGAAFGLALGACASRRRR